jgi:hypothetical protein
MNKSRFNKTKHGALSALAASVALACNANAASVTVYLNETNVGGPRADNLDYLGVTISDGLAGAIDFRIETLEPLDGSKRNAGIQKLSFDFGASGAAIENLILPDGWKAQSNKNESIFGSFDVRLMGTGKSRLEPLQFSIAGVNNDIPEDYAKRFAAQVAGFDSEYVTNGHFGGQVGVVPLPPAIGLLGSASAVLGLIGARRRKYQATRAAANATVKI